jgi:hypothetical protein
MYHIHAYSGLSLNRVKRKGHRQLPTPLVKNRNRLNPIQSLFQIRHDIFNFFNADRNPHQAIRNP